MAGGPIREIEDPAALRALAHPLRLRLLGSLRIHGPGTASTLGRRLGESSGATSFHLRSLAKHGFVVDDESRGNGRERWWRAADTGSSWSLAPDEAGRAEAGRALTRLLVHEHARRLLAFVDGIDDWPFEWRDTAIVSDRYVTVTPDRLTELNEEIAKVVERYADEPSTTEDAERVLVIYDAFPERGDPA
jgi:DNA-binding transcriptional ArsR family regulator